MKKGNSKRRSSPGRRTAKATHSVRRAGRQARVGKVLTAAHARQALALDELQAEVARFHAGLLADIGGNNPTSIQRAAILAAVASFTALYRANNVLLRMRRLRRPERLFDKISRLEGALRRALHELLPQEKQGSTPELTRLGLPPCPDGPVEARMAWSQRYVEALHAEDRKKREAQ